MSEKVFYFADYPIEFSHTNDEIYLTCKGVIGTLTQVENFLEQSKGGGTYYFGKSKIRHKPDGKIRIDCLIGTEEQIIQVYNHAKTLKCQRQ